MAIVTGDRYLDLLARFVEEHAGGLLDGSLVLKLNPVGLHYVQTRLDALHELERIRTGAPVDYLRAYISDLGDHRALEQLSRVLNLLTAVKVVSVLPPPARDPSPVTLSPFGRLKSLELRGCDLSTSAARGLLQLRPTLERLICHNSADALRHIFTERIVEVKDSPVWSRLAFVSCAGNGMILMDESLQLLPHVQFLDLSRNHFAKAANLQSCAKLKFLDLGFNQLRSISSLRQIRSTITKLVLKNNALVSVHGIAALTSLEDLDLSNNLISKFKEIQPVAAVRSLQTLFLEGNPLSSHPYYREEVFSLFMDSRKVSLDGRKILRLETWMVNRIKSERLKQEALYGSYAPAAVMAETQTGVEHRDYALDGGTCTLRGKPSRLALIHDAQMLSLEQDESSGYHVSSSQLRDGKERWQDSLDEGDQDKIGALQLMEKVEALKEEGSKTWLQELRVLLDKNNYFSEESQKYIDPLLEGRGSIVVSKLKELRKLRSKRQRRRQQRSYRGSMDKEQEESLKGWLEKDKNMRLERDQGESSRGFSKDSQEHPSLTTKSILSGPTIGTSSPLASPSSEVVCNLEDMVPSDKDTIEPYGHANASYVPDEGQTSMDESFGSWRLLDEVVDSRGAESGLQSPPHFHEDVLQKRQDLEDELLRLSVDSGCAISSSENDSSSDNSFIMISGSSTDSEVNNSNIGHSNTWQGSHCAQSGLEDNVQHCTSEDSTSSVPNEEKASESSGDQHLSAMPSWQELPQEKATEAQRSTHLNPSCTDDIRANAGGGQSNAEVSLGKPRKRRKPRRVRTVELYKEVDGIEKCSVENMEPLDWNGRDPKNRVPMAEMAAALSKGKLNCCPSDEATRHGESKSTLSYEDPQGDRVEKFFRLKVANAEEEEVLYRHFRCGCIRLWDESPSERDLHFVLSNKDKLYMIAQSSSRTGKLSAEDSDLDLQVTASHRLQDVRMITVGLGLQALRVDIGHGASYLFVTRDVDESRDILDIFQAAEDWRPAPGFESWEQRQLRMFEKFVLGGAQTNILMYLMALFSQGDAPGNAWFTRSVFLTSHHIFVCIEDLIHFGASEELMSCHPYFVMETAADMRDLLEVVVGFTEGCVILRFGKTILVDQQKGPQKEQGPTVWKFKGVLGDAATKLVALLHATSH